MLEGKGQVRTQSIVRLLSQDQVFAKLSDPERMELAQLARQCHYQRGEFIVHNGDIWPYLLAVESGVIGAVKTSLEGRALTVLMIEPGQFLWGLALIRERVPMPVSLQAQRESIVHLWNRESLLPVIQRNCEVLWEMSRMLVERMLHASEIVDGLAFQPLTRRLARLLLERFDQGGEGVPVARDMTLDDMAAVLGSTREMVCRLLYRFADMGLVDITRTEFVFTDRSRLKRIADDG